MTFAGIAWGLVACAILAAFAVDENYLLAAKKLHSYLEQPYVQSCPARVTSKNR